MICSGVSAQSVGEIKSLSSEYLWGEGKGSTLKKADSEALSSLISQISTTVESNFSLLQQENSGDAKYTETFNSVIETYSNATLNNTERIVIANEPDAHVFRYIRRSELNRIFEGRKNKIIEFAENGLKAEKSLQIADALRYYYWSLTLLRSHPDGNFIKGKNENREECLLATWLPMKINDVLGGLSVSISDVKDAGTYKEVILNITSNGMPVRNFDYTYWDGRDWSNIVSAKDGRGVAELPLIADPESLRIKCEYIFEGEANIDAELRDVLERLDAVPFRKCYLTMDGDSPLKSTETGTLVTGNMAQESQGNTASGSFEVEDATPYLAIMKKIEQAISDKTYNSVGQYFTPEGYDMFNRLIRYGQARIIRTPEYNLVQFDGDVICRSLPMSFSFKNNKRTFIEDVVFCFSEQKKIKSLSFGLSKPVLDDLLTKGVWDAKSRLILAQFLENYKTAYALKRLDYIESIFADDALIIVGSVLKRQAMTESQRMMSDKVVRLTKQTKEEYVKRLRHTFAGNEYINLKFTDNLIRKSGKGGEIYGIQIKQDYFSANYGDTGYLFLMVDLNNPEEPIIHVRAWQPEKDPDFGLIDLSYF